jgi:carboxyl-terminal processing protease
MTEFRTRTAHTDSHRFFNGGPTWLFAAVASLVYAFDPAASVAVVEDALPVAAVEIPAADPVVDSVKEALRILGDFHLKIDPSDGHERIVVDVLRLYDPGVHLVATNGPGAAPIPEGSAYGIGVRLSRSNGVGRITEVLPDSPAAGAELDTGDRILAVDDQSILDLDIAEMMQLLRGSEAGPVTLHVASWGKDARDIVVEKNIVPVPDIEEELTLPLGLYYLRVNRLGLESGAKILGTLTAWSMEEPGGIVLDLRGAGGTNVQSAVDVASAVTLPKTLLFSFRDGNDEDLEVYHSEDATQLRAPLIVLADRNTTGSAELLVATVGGVGRGAMVIGEQTSGDPMIRRTISLRNGDQVRLATRRLVVGNGDAYTGREAVRPDVQVGSRQIYTEYEPGPPMLTDPRGTGDNEKETQELHNATKGDAVLTRAVDVLLGLRALQVEGYRDADSLDR